MARLSPQRQAQGQRIAYYLAFSCFLGGMLFSKFLLSLSTILPVLAALVLVGPQGLYRALLQNRLAQGGLGIVLLVALSGLYSQDTHEWWTRLRVLLPIGFLPLALAALKRPNSRDLENLHRLFLLAYALAALAVMGNYALDYQAITESMSHSKPIPCPEEDHIRFSLALCLACFSALYWQHRRQGRWQLIYRLAALFFALILHVLSVRSGLLALYLGLGFYLVHWIYTQRRFLLGFALLSLLLATPIVAYFGLDSFRAKVHLSLYNVELYQKGRIDDYSDTQRLLSYSIAWELSQRNPIFGLGMGDLWPEQQAIYKARYPTQRMMFPHNQFLSFLAGTGIVGLLVFLWGIFWPLSRKKQRQSALVVSTFLCFFSSFLTENTLFVSMGVHLYAYGLMLSFWTSEE